MLNRRSALAFLAANACASRAFAHSYQLGEIAIGHAWGLPTQSSETQIFVPMSNRGAAPDELDAARSPICTLIELRQNNRYDDPALKSIELLPGKPVAMRMGGRHLRLIGLAQPLKPGDRFEMTLDFLNAGETLIEVMIEEIPGQ